MDAGLLAKIFGRDQRWHGPCTVVLDAEAAIQSLGADSIVGGGAKHYAPRMISGRINGDVVSLLQDGTALLIVQHHKVKHSTGEEVIRQTLTVADATHIVAIEFPDAVPLAQLGLIPPPMRSPGHSGIYVHPM